MNILNNYLAQPLSASGRLLCYSIGKPLLMLGILLSWPLPEIGGTSFISASILFVLGLVWVNRYGVLALLLAGVAGWLIYQYWYPHFDLTGQVLLPEREIMWIIGILLILAANCGILSLLSVAKRT